MPWAINLQPPDGGVLCASSSLTHDFSGVLVHSPANNEEFFRTLEEDRVDAETEPRGALPGWHYN